MPVVIDPDLREVGCQQLAFHIVGSGSVERARLLQQIQVVQDHVTFLLDDFSRCRQPLGEFGSLDLEFAQPVTHLVRGERSVSSQIEQALLLHVEGGQLLLDSRMGLALGTEPLFEMGCDQLTHGGNFVSCQPERLHFPEQGLLNQRHRKVVKVARPFLPPGTEIVLIHRPLRIGNL